MNAPTSLIPLVEANPVMVLVEPEKFDRFYEEMKRETDAHVPDLTTEKGRKAIASLAFKVARTKTAIDDAGKKLNEEARAKINLVDEARRNIRDKLDALKDEIRKPLNEWEAAEEARTTECKAAVERLKQAAVVTMDDTEASVGARLATVQAEIVDSARFIEWAAIATAARENAITVLTAARSRLAREAADRAELDRLRKESAEREEQERAAREAADLKAREEAAAKVAAERKAAAEAAEEARIAAATKAAEDRATAEAERKAREEKEAQARAHAEALAAEKRRADEAEAARKADQEKRDRLAAEQAAEAKRAADEQAHRDANRAHRAKVLGEVKIAVMAHGIGETAAKAVVLAIAAGEVPHVSIKF